nr:endonuclease/exonuclease/phosphatase family protein [uncultured Mucilaginibacter sp.]
MKASKKKLLVDKVILYINIILSLALLMSYLAPFADPRSTIIIAVLGLICPFLLLGNLPFVVYWALRKPRFVLISGLSILAGVHTTSLYYGFNKQTEPGKKLLSTDIRIMQYNVRGFEGVGDYQNIPTNKPILDVIESQRPDIITLEEFASSKQNHDSVINRLKTILKTNYYFFKTYSKTSTQLFGNAIFSKYPIVDTGSFLTNRKMRTKIIFADVAYAGSIIRIYCIHLKAVNITANAKNKYLNGEVELSQSSFVLGRIDTAFAKRAAQVNQIKSHLKKCRYPFIIAGDFNDTPNSFAVNNLGRGLKNAFSEKGSGFQTTYYSKFPLRIDYILTSPEFDVLTYKALDKKISDHKPIVADLRLNPLLRH